MKHYVAYHNEEKRGLYIEEFPLNVWANKKLDFLMGHTLWLIVGIGGTSKDFAIGSVFKVERVGFADSEDFMHEASGNGFYFNKREILNNYNWFQELKRKNARFSIGIQEIKDESIIKALVGIREKYEGEVS